MIVEIVETTEIRDIPSSSEVAGLITPARFPTAQRKRLLARILALGEDAIARWNNRSQERCGKLLGFLYDHTPGETAKGGIQMLRFGGVQLDPIQVLRRG